MADSAPDWSDAYPDAAPVVIPGTAKSVPASPAQSQTASDWSDNYPDAAPMPQAQPPSSGASNPNTEAPNAFDTATEKAANMATFGMGAPIDAAASVAADKVRGLVGLPTKGTTYDQGLSEAQQRQESESEEHPIASMIGNVAGFGAGLGGTAINAVKSAPTLLDMAIQGSKFGIPTGAISSAANTQGDLETKAEAGGIGGIAGGILGGTTPYLAAGASKLVSPITALARPFLKSGQDLAAGKILNEATEGRPIVPQSAPLPGVDLTTGQATNDPGLLWLEKSLMQKNPAAAVQQETANNQTMTKAASSLGNARLAPEAPDTIQSGIETARDANQKIVRDSWKLAGVDDATPLSTQPLKDDVNNYVSNLPKADQEHVPPGSLNVLSSFGENEPLGEIQALRSDLQSKATAASRAGDYNKARILGGLTDVVGAHADDPSIAAKATSGQLEDMFSNASSSAAQAQKNLTSLQNQMTGLQARAQTNPSVYAPNANNIKALQSQIDEAQTSLQQAQDVKNTTLDRLNEVRTASTGDGIPAYQQARAETANFKQNFTQPAPIRNVLGVDKYGADKVPLSAVPDQFIRTGKGAPEAFGSFMNAVRQADPATQANTLDAARNYFAGKFFDNVTSNAQDQLGSNKIIGNKVDNFLQDYAHVVNSPLFTDAQRQTMKDIATSARMASRTAKFTPPGGGSPTYGYLEQGRFVDALLNGWQKQALKAGAATLGGVAGSHAGPIGTLGGIVGGSELASKLYNAPQAKIQGILQDAMRDPKLAQTLQMKANQFSQKAMNPHIYRYLSAAAVNAGNAVQRKINSQ